MEFFSSQITQHGPRTVLRKWQWLQGGYWLRGKGASTLSSVHSMSLASWFILWECFELEMISCFSCGPDFSSPQEDDRQCFSKVWSTIWTGCFAEDTFHVLSDVNCWYRKALKLNTLTEG